MTVFELRGGYEADAAVERALHGLGLGLLDGGRSVTGLSGGEQVRLRLAAVLAAGPEVLLLDEPTNHLDADALRWLEEHLRGRRRPRSADRRRASRRRRRRWCGPVRGGRRR